jgi:hypothetical protein
MAPKCSVCGSTKDLRSISARNLEEIIVFNGYPSAVTTTHRLLGHRTSQRLCVGRFVCVDHMPAPCTAATAAAVTKIDPVCRRRDLEAPALPTVAGFSCENIQAKVRCHCYPCGSVVSECFCTRSALFRLLNGVLAVVGQSR